jgi:hypothetical protein
MVNRVVERACRALANQIKGLPWTTGVILVAMPKDATSLDSSFSGQEQEIQVGEVWAIGVHRSWQVIWNPESDQGRLSSSGFYDYRV